MNMKKAIIYTLCLLLCFGSLMPISASAADSTAAEATATDTTDAATAAPEVKQEAAVVYNNSFADKAESTIGIMGIAVTVGADTVFQDSEGNDVTIAFDGAPTLESGESPYPVCVQSFDYGTLSCTLTRFAYYGSSDKELCVYSRLQAINSGETNRTFPVTQGMVAITDVPDTVNAGEEVTVDYKTVVASTGKEAEKNYSFDSAYGEMKAYWDKYIESISPITETTIAVENTYNQYKAELVADAIAGKSDSLMAALDGRGKQGSFEKLYGEFLYYTYSNHSLTEDEAASIADSIAERAMSIAGKVKQVKCSYSDGIHLIGNDGIYSLEENLDAVVELCSADALLIDVINTYALLIESIEKVLLNTEKLLPDTWPVATLNEKTVEILSDGKDGFDLYFQMDKAANALYRMSLRLGVVGTVKLNDKMSRLANTAYDYTDAESLEAADLVSGCVYVIKKLGKIYMGSGLFNGIFAKDGTVKVELENGITVSLTSKKSTVTAKIKYDEKLWLPPVVCLSGLNNNLKDKDAELECTGNTKFKLIKPLSEIAAENNGQAFLDLALFNASLVSTENCTSVSKEQFEEALKSAQTADGYSAEDKIRLAQALDNAVLSLTNTVTGYTVDLCKTDEIHTPGNIKLSRIYQKFTALGNGEIDEIFVGGKYEHHIFAAIHPAPNKYETADMIAAVVGTPTDGGITFTFDKGVCKLEKDKEYVLCLFTEKGTADFAVCQSGASDMFEDDGTTLTVYSGATLDAEITVRQADLTKLDNYYNKCRNTDISEYTKESVKVLHASMREAAVILCTPYADESSADSALDNMKDAFDRLSTYASDAPLGTPPVMLYILLGVVVVLLCGSLFAVTGIKKSNKTEGAEKKEDE